MRHVVLLLVLALAPSRAVAQAVVVRAPGAAAVLVDGEVRGVPGDVIAVAPGARVIAVVDVLDRWDPRRASVTVTVPAADTLGVSLRLPLRVRVETLPLRSEVVWIRPDGTRQPLGTAPLTADLPPDATGRVEAEADGYAPASAPIGDGAVLLTLTPLDGARPDVTTQVALAPSPRRPWLDLGLGAATLAAGAVAVHYKVRADRVDDRYRAPGSAERGDEALRQEALRLDRYSGVALGLMQVGVGVIAVRLVLR